MVTVVVGEGASTIGSRTSSSEASIRGGKKSRADNSKGVIVTLVATKARKGEKGGKSRSTSPSPGEEDSKPKS